MAWHSAKHNLRPVPMGHAIQADSWSSNSYAHRWAKSGISPQEKETRTIMSSFPRLRNTSRDSLKPRIGYNECLHHRFILVRFQTAGAVDDPAVWAGRLDGRAEGMALVGHLPHLARLTSLLLTDDPDRETVRFSNAGVVCVERAADGGWVLLWSVVPALLA